MKGTTVKQREGGGREGRRQGKRDRGREGKHTGACGVTLEFQVCGRLRGELPEPTSLRPAWVTESLGFLNRWCVPQSAAAES